MEPQERRGPRKDGRQRSVGRPPGRRGAVASWATHEVQALAPEVPRIVFTVAGIMSAGNKIITILMISVIYASPLHGWSLHRPDLHV